VLPIKEKGLQLCDIQEGVGEISLWDIRIEEGIKSYLV